MLHLYVCGQRSWAHVVSWRRRQSRVTVGTIHSVKGGEADVVFSFRISAQRVTPPTRRHGPQRDSVVRLF